MRVAGPHSKEPGSKFLVCPMRQPGSADDCGTFVWLGADEHGTDEVGDAGGYMAPLRGTGYAAFGGGAGAPHATTGGAPAAVVCYLCHQPGHYASMCLRAQAMPSLGQGTPKQAVRGRSASSGRVAGGSRVSADRSPASARRDRFPHSKRARKSSTGSRSHSKGSSTGKRSGVKVPKIGFVTADEEEHEDAHSSSTPDDSAWAAKPDPHAHHAYAPPPPMPSASRTPIRGTGAMAADAGTVGGSAAAAAAGASPSTSVRKCSVCKKAGHTKAKCPLNLDRLAGFADL